MSHWRIQERAGGAKVLPIRKVLPTRQSMGAAIEISPSQISLKLVLKMGKAWENGVKNWIFYDSFSLLTGLIVLSLLRE